MADYIVALDQGTTSARCIIFDKQGNVCGKVQRNMNMIYPKPGWVEQNARELWSYQLAVMMEALAMEGISGEDIAAIGIANQRETTIVWNKKTGKAIYNAIVWQCRRTAEELQKKRTPEFDELIISRTGLIPDAYFSASKIAWILDNVEGAREMAERDELLFGTVDTWLMWNLSGRKIHVTDYTNASRTMLFDIHRLCWDEDILREFNIPLSMMPEVKPSSCVYGTVSHYLLGGNVPIAGAVGDQQSALFGQCCFEKGEVKATYGTGCFLLMHTGDTPVASEKGLITTIAATVDDKVQYALEGSVFAAGATIQWLRDEMELIQNADETERLAASVPNSNEVYIVPAFAGMGAPYWSPYARGTVVGLTRGCKKEHFIRAVLESLAYQCYDVIHAMEEDVGVPFKNLKVDGGASVNNLLVQFQADIAGATVYRPACVETTAMGAAFLAGLAIGFWKDMDELKSCWQLGHEYVPSMGSQTREKLLKGWRRAIRAALAWAEEE